MLMFRDLPGPSPVDADVKTVSLHDLWSTVSRHRWLVASVWLAVVAATVALTKMQAPVYTSLATMRIEDPRDRTRILSDMFPLGGGRGQSIETEMLVLGSRQIAEAVVDSLQMQVQVLEPKRARATLFSQVVAPRTATPGEYELRWDGRRSAYTVNAGDGTRGPVPPRAVPGVPFRLGGVTLTLRPELRTAHPDRISLVVQSFRAAVGGVQGSLVVARVNRDADIVSLRYQSSDPDLAAAVPNAVAQSFIGYKTRSSKSESHSTVEFLRTQVANYESQLAGAEQRLKSFRESARVVNPEEQASEQVKRLADVQAHRDELRLERESLGRALADARAAPTPEASIQRYRQLGSFPTFLGNAAVQDVMRSLTEFENQRTQLLLRRQETAPEVQAIDERIRDLENSLYRTAQAYGQGLDSQIQGLDATLSQFGAQLESIPAREIDYARLLRQQKLLEQIYTLLQTRLKESEINDAAEPGEVRLIDSALVPLQPSSPRPLRNLAFAIVVGLFLGFG
ncbi:MAG TPA: GumC family protein, partial [Longimicrobiaceae bacterium]